MIALEINFHPSASFLPDKYVSLSFLQFLMMFPCFRAVAILADTLLHTTHIILSTHRVFVETNLAGTSHPLEKFRILLVNSSN